MPTGTATITAKTGPAVQNTAAVLANVSKVEYDVAGSIVRVTQNNPSRVQEFDMGGVTTATITITGGNLAFVVS